MKNSKRSLLFLKFLNLVHDPNIERFHAIYRGSVGDATHCIFFGLCFKKNFKVVVLMHYRKGKDAGKRECECSNKNYRYET